MKKIKVSEATNNQLDWLVAKCEQVDCTNIYGHLVLEFIPRYTINPVQMWPIIERELLSPDPLLDYDCSLIRWRCRNWKGDDSDYYGSTSLIAAARCYIVSKLGEEVEVPKELT